MSKSKQFFVYVVSGESGDYEERQEWTVVAYLEREPAEQYAVEAQRIANKLDAAHRRLMDSIHEHEDWPTRLDALKAKHALDPDFQFGAKYAVGQVLLLIKVPKRLPRRKP